MQHVLLCLIICMYVKLAIVWFKAWNLDEILTEIPTNDD